jgi:hypothetical protein
MNTFTNVAPGKRGDFLLHFYAAIYRLLYYLNSFSQKGKENLEDAFKKFPFLAGYFEEIRQFMPGEITWEEALKWWQAQISAWEKKVSQHLPLQAVTQNNGISFQSLTALMLVGLVEEDSRFGTLFNHIQAPLDFRRPCLEMLGQVIRYDGDGGDIDPWVILNPLLSSGLVEVLNKDAPRSEWVLRVPAILWNVIRDEIPEQPASWCEYYPADGFTSIKNKAESIVLRSTPGSDRLQAAGALARVMNQSIIAVEGKNEMVEKNRELLGPLCTLSSSLPLISYDLAPGETAEVSFLKGYKGPYIILVGSEGGLQGKVVEKAVSLTLPTIGASDRKQCWEKALDGHPLEKPDEVSERFHIPGGYIRKAASMAAAHAALERRETISINDVRHACRSLNRQLLDTLAAHLEVEGSWGQLIVNTVTADKLYELEKRCRHREKLFDNLGPAFGSAKNTGVRALFSGASGTGKTLAAKILAAELGMDLYRVDLAAVVNKYIGETEKNLHKVLTRAEELDVILLLDEGDALLGTRTEVKTANDRYANLETDYLLQKLENYQGIVVITTNAVENIDNAFQRRMDVLVSFVPPQPQERLLIWQLHLPGDNEIDYTVLENAAVRCAMNGGQIRNAALNAALLALDENSAVNNFHLTEAIHSEYRKAGAICPLNENTQRKEKQGGIQAFFDVLGT